MTKIEEIKAEIAKLQEKIERLEAEAARDDEWPKEGDKFWFTDNDGIGFYADYYAEEHDAMKAIGNCFCTREEAEFAVERLKVLAEMRKYAFEPDWENHKQEKWCLRYNLNYGICVDCYDRQDFGVPVFESEERARECILAIGEERLKKYWFGVKDVAQG